MPGSGREKGSASHRESGGECQGKCREVAVIKRIHLISEAFFEENADALAGKTLISFSTHEGSGLSGFDKSLASSCPDSTIGEGLAIRGSDAQNDQENVRSEVNDWIAESGI